MTQLQRRGDERVDSPLLVFLDNARGVTRDVSPSGAFFWTSGTYAVGDPISFAIELKTARGRMMRKCRGSVVRTERLAHMVGVAASITDSRMVSA